MARRDKLNLSGSRFGKLTVLSEAAHYRQHSMWLCQCDCGNTKIIRGAQLVRKNEATRSCGCLRGNDPLPDVNDKLWVAWAAGITDGEGCIALSRDKLSDTAESYSLRVSVSNTDPKMLDKLKAMFGGVISKHGRKAKAHYLDQWCWRVGSKQAANFLQQVLPWLVTKRSQAELAILSRKYLRTSRWDTGNLNKQRQAFKQLKLLKRDVSENAGQSVPLIH